MPQLFTRALLREKTMSGNRTACRLARFLTTIEVVAVPELRSSLAVHVIVTFFCWSPEMEASNWTPVEL